jgi:acyl-coenzyme A thioesterase PaaI-like protein
MTSDAPINADDINGAISRLWIAGSDDCVDVSPSRAVARREIDQSTLRPGAFVSGPAQFSLADAVLWYLVFGALNRIEPMALTSELSIRFLRPAQGTTIWARADLEKAGRTSVVGTVRLWMDDANDRPVSTAQGTYALPRPGERG